MYEYAKSLLDFIKSIWLLVKLPIYLGTKFIPSGSGRTRENGKENPRASRRATLSKFSSSLYEASYLSLEFLILFKESDG